MRNIKNMVPENTSENTLLAIIQSCEGNMELIDLKIRELWEGGVEDQWETVLTRKEKVVLLSIGNIDSTQY